MSLTMRDLEQIPELPGGIYTVDTGQTLILWYDQEGKRHINGLGVRIA